MKYLNMIPIRRNRSTRMSDMTLNKSANIFVNKSSYLNAYLSVYFANGLAIIHWCEMRTYGHDFLSSISKLSRWFLHKGTIAFDVSTDKDFISKYKDVGKNDVSCFAWPVNCTVLKLQDVVRRFSSTGTRYLLRKQAANETPHKESKAQHVTNKSTWRSTDLEKIKDKYACEDSWRALPKPVIWPRCCLSRSVQETVT
jgi:hypothetical protein